MAEKLADKTGSEERDDEERRRCMVADKKRRLKDGGTFDHLFPPPSETDTTIKKSADVEDTLRFIRTALPQTLWQTERIAKALKGRTLEETCSNIWHFVYEHIQYKRDEDGVEQVRSPRRTWWDRKTGVDCDCYTVFILSILRSLNIDCLARITKYPKKYHEVPRWQHVYPIVPKPGHMEDYIDERDWYIVIDCVKDDFDDEQPYLECKDYDMRLDYLDGIGEMEERQTGMQDEAQQFMDFDYADPDNVDLADLASIYDDEELGNIFKKIGGAVKKVANKVGSAVKTVAKNIKQTAPILAKKVGDDIGKGVRFINRYVNPATVVLRNGFLLAMKVNLMNVGGKLRYAYLTDAQAQAKGINLSELKKLRAIKDRAETVYWQAGGKKNNLKKAILGGKGNKDKKVPLSGFEGVDGLDDVYADYDEYRIIHSGDELEGLGEIASGTAIAAASGAVAAIAAALKQVKGLFSKGGGEEQAFQSETDNAGSASSAPAMISEDEDLLVNEATSQSTLPSAFSPNMVTATAPTPFEAERRMPATTTSETSTALQTQEDPSQKIGFVQKTATWVKENPGKSLLVAGGVITGGFLLAKAMRSGGNARTLSGLPPKSKRKGRRHRSRKSGRKNKVKPQNLL